MNTYYVAGIPYSDELYHHGILGQKWGVRRFQNKDGTRTAAGKERYSTAKEQKKLANLASKVKPYNYTYNQYISDKIRKTPQVQQAANDLKESAAEVNNLRSNYEKEEEKFYSDNKMYDKYLNKAVDNAMKEWANEAGLERDEVKEAFLEGDLDQGSGSAIEYYKNSKDGASLRKAESAWATSYKKLNDECKTYANAFLGEYGDNKVGQLAWNGIGSSTRTVKQRVADIMADEAQRKNYSFSDKMVNLRKAI